MKTVLVTGATDGIGGQTALELARRGVHVILHGRNEARLSKARDRIQQEVPDSKIDLARCDLAALADVRRMAADIETRFERLDVLINNAGVYMNERVVTTDGYELTFQVNHLSHFLLTHLLLDKLRNSEDGRIINVSSIAHTRGRIYFEDLDGQDNFNGYLAYAQSKLANVLFSVELASRLGAHPVVNSLHPGVVDTKLLNDGMGARGSDSLEEGAATSVMLATSDAGRTVTGRYFRARKEADAAPRATDLDVARQLYEVSAERAGVTPLSSS